MGTCWHTFAKSTDRGSVGRPAFQVEAKMDDLGSNTVSYVTEIRLLVNGEADPLGSSGELRYKIEGTRTGLKIYDQETGLEYENFFDGDGIQATFSHDGIVITTWFGLIIKYQNGNWGLELTLPDCYKNSVDGLCGNWDGRKYDDKNVG